MKLLRKTGKFYTDIIISNIGIFIFIGILSSVFQSRGWIPNEEMYAVSQLTYKYLLPSLLAYEAGKRSSGSSGGGTLGLMTAAGVLAGENDGGILGALLLGTLAGILWKKEERIFERNVSPGFQMLARNLGLAFTGLAAAFVGYGLFGPALSCVKDVLYTGVDCLTGRGLTVFLCVIVEPAKVFFLNNIVNHGILIPLGMNQVQESGESVLFLLEANPGPGLGVLLALLWAGKRKRGEYLAAAVAETAGGLHEVYFPYVLSDLRLLFPLIAGGAAGTVCFGVWNAGVQGAVSPGSVFLILLLSGRENMAGVAGGILLSAAVSFAISLLILKKRSPEAKDTLLEEKRKVMEPEKTELKKTEPIQKIVFVCDAGVGSSAMGAAILRRLLRQRGTGEITVEACASDMLPDETDLIVCQKEIRRLLPDGIPEEKFYLVESFVDPAEYDNLVSLVSGELFETR